MQYSQSKNITGIASLLSKRAVKEWAKWEMSECVVDDTWICLLLLLGAVLEVVMIVAKVPAPAAMPLEAAYTVA
jgi:hypothetical protein